MILNRDNYPRLYDDGTVDFGNKPTILRYPNLFDDKDYWYIEILYTYKTCENPPIKKIEDCIPREILEKIKSEDIFLLILGIEPYPEVVEDVYRFIKNLSVPENKVVLITELIDIGYYINRACITHNLDKIKTYYVSIDEHSVSSYLKKNRIYYMTAKPLNHTSFNKSFINFNRRWRVHRPLFVSLLYCKNLLDKGYVSLGDTKENILNLEQTFRDMMNVSDIETRELLLENQERIVNMNHLYVDTEDLSVNLAELEQSTKRFYQETYFSVVSETCFFHDVGRFLTEKTFKAIAHNHPFILLAPPKTLEYLREQGYKTFHPFIDETYDTITDNMSRMKAVLAETERLCNLPELELQEFIKNMRPIVAHNFKVLLTRTSNTFITEVG